MKRLTNTGPVLSVSVAGGRGGKVTSSPSGIDCGDTRSAAFTQGTQVTFSATAAAAWGFAGWGGACSGVAPSCAATISASTSASAIYHPFCCPSGFPARCRGAAARGAVAAFRGADRILRSSGQRRRTARAGLRGWLEVESRWRSGPLRLDSEVMRVDVLTVMIERGPQTGRASRVVWIAECAGDDSWRRIKETPGTRTFGNSRL